MSTKKSLQKFSHNFRQFFKTNRNHSKMIQYFCRNWSILALIILSGIVVSNNVNSQETNQKFGSNAPTITFLYWYVIIN